MDERYEQFQIEFVEVWDGVEYREQDPEQFYASNADELLDHICARLVSEDLVVDVPILERYLEQDPDQRTEPITVARTRLRKIRNSFGEHATERIRVELRTMVS